MVWASELVGIREGYWEVMLRNTEPMRGRLETSRSRPLGVSVRSLSPITQAWTLLPHRVYELSVKKDSVV